MRFGKLVATFRAYRAGAPLGDVVLLKLDALAFPPPGIQSRLPPLADDESGHDVAALRQLPPGTLGRAYAHHLDANGIEPLRISPAMRERFRSEPYALRYTMTHDLHHVLTGFDTGLAGEIGLVAFNVGQGSAPVPAWMLWVAVLVYTLVSPTQARRIVHNARVGRALGQRARLVMVEPLESLFAEPLEGVRSRLGIPAPGASGILASGRSVVVRWITPRPRAAAG